MSPNGTASYRDADDVPPLVRRAVALAEELGFGNSCRIEQGRLLAVLGAGFPSGLVGETGTGCGVGLAWMVSAAGADTRFVSVEVDDERARRSAELFADRPNVTVLQGDWSSVLDHAPLDLLVLDGGSGKNRAGDQPAVEAVRVGGSIVIDDFTPWSSWPPRHGGGTDEARMFWLEHPSLAATDIRLAGDLSCIVATRIR